MGDAFEVAFKALVGAGVGAAIGVGVAARWLPTLAAIPVGGVAGAFAGGMVGMIIADRP